MAYLLHICFDNSHRLSSKRYLFEYREVRFKLVQGSPYKSADHLLTIVPDKDDQAHENAFSIAAEFLNALGWEHRAQVKVWLAGGRGWPNTRSLREANPCIFNYPRISAGNVRGFTLNRIPHVQNPEQQIALALFTEANASNNDYLSFLFFWQVLQVKGDDPKTFVEMHKHDAHLRVEQSALNKLSIGNRRLGTCLEEDYRHAIAHVRRFKGRKPLDLNKLGDRMRLAISTRVIKAFAEHYIRTDLKLTEHLYRNRQTRGNFPKFLPMVN